ncbi:hypothetical protein FHT21_004968 [Pedobacter sp. SG908]|nr:hypothetical protein [Pedobacter sp. SG908]NMN39245.1 hypothetical protein [Pedobacter sp. SG918]
MKIAIVAGLFTKRDMDIDTRHWSKDSEVKFSLLL